MNKGSTYVLVALLSVLVVFLSIFLYYAINNEKFGRKKAELQLNENYEFDSIDEINVTTKSADIKIEESEDDKIYVEIYASKDEDFSSKLNDNKLDIKLKNSVSFCFFCIGNRYTRRINIKLPKSYDGKINIDTKSGDLSLGDYKDASLSLSARSGDLNIKSIKKLDANLTSGDVEIDKVSVAKIKATSGDIVLKNVTKSVDIKVTSGDVDIDEFEIKDNSKIEATSGDVKVKELSDAFVDTSVKSGDVKVNGSNRNAEYELVIKVTSGDINVN